MSPIRSVHVGTVLRLSTRFMRALGGCALVSVQNRVRLSRYSESQPDIVLLRPREDFHAGALPAPAARTPRLDRGRLLPR
jgi:hypothetical protein